MRNKITAGVILIMVQIMGGGAVAAQPADPAQNIRVTPRATLEAKLENEARLYQVVQSMNREMALLRDTTDSAKREELMNMHKRHLHETMMLLRMTAGDSMVRILNEHMPAAFDRSLQEGAVTRGERTPDEDRIYKLEERIDMLQVVMESMLDHLTMPGVRR